MAASKQIESPFYRGIGRERKHDAVALAQFLGKLQFYSCVKTSPRGKRVGADLLDFCAPETAEIVDGRKIIKTTKKSVWRQFLMKQLSSGSWKRTASEVIPPQSVKQTSRSRRDISTNISDYSCRANFRINVLWQFPEILEGRPQ